MPVYGNVNVKYTPCKSTAQLHSAADYILGQKKEQLSSGIIKTKPELYNAFGCNRDNFANSILMTRKMHQKKYSRFFPRDILAQKVSISFHPDDNDKFTYEDAYKIAEDFAREFFWKKGFEVLFAVHIDTNHVHVHFLVSNCNQKDGSSFRRGPKELVEMSKYFGEQCKKRGLTHSIRDSFYNHDKAKEERTFAETQMKKRGKLTFKDEIKVYIRLAMNDATTKTMDDVVDMLRNVYGMNIRLKGNTISYALPYRSSNGGKVQAVRGSRLGKRFTVAGIREYMEEKKKRNLEYHRAEQDIEYSSQSVKDYSRWEEDKADETDKKKADITPYEAYDQFQEEHEIPENDGNIFYGTAFDDFNKEWQGANAIDEKKQEKEEKSFYSPEEYRKMSIEERTKILPPPTDDTMGEFHKYMDRMGYSDESVKGIRYKMELYDDFNDEFDYRKKYAREYQQEEKNQDEQITIPVRRRGRG